MKAVVKAKSEEKDSPKRSIGYILMIYCGIVVSLIFNEIHNVIQMFVWGDYFREGKRKRRKFYQKRIRV